MDLPQCFADPICLTPSDDGLSLRDWVRRISRDELGQVSTGVPSAEIVRRALQAVSSLQLQAIVGSGMSLHQRIEAAIIVAEELGAGDLQIGTHAILPVVRASLMHDPDSRENLDRDIANRPISPVGLGFARAVPGGFVACAMIQARDEPMALFSEDEGCETSVIRLPPSATALLWQGPPSDHVMMDTIEFVSFSSSLVRDDRHPAPRLPDDGMSGMLLRLMLMGLLVGAARQAVSDAFSYAKQRHAFGRSIVTHQLVASRLCDMISEAEAAKLTLWHAASAVGLGRIDSYAMNLAVRQITVSARKIMRDAVQTCGAHGFVDGGLPHARRYRLAAALSAMLQIATTQPKGAACAVPSNFD
jgi:hypothetical protein